MSSTFDGTDMFKDYFEVFFLLQFICVEFCIPAFEFFHYVDINNGAIGLDFNLLIVCNFDFISANGNFF
jgi:hypothetical protein